MIALRPRLPLRERPHPPSAADLTSREFSYSPVGTTHPEQEYWSAPKGFLKYERTVLLGRGEECWRRARGSVLEWGVKTRSGFYAFPPRAVQGSSYWLLATLGPFTVSEPVRVIRVVDSFDRCGFSYGTLTGHPVSGEEAFVVHRSSDGRVWLTLRSLTAPGMGRWRLLFPFTLLAQQVYRVLYSRALRDL